MSTDEKIAAILAAHPPVLRDCNPVCICVCSPAIVFQVDCVVNRNLLRSMNRFHRIELELLCFGICDRLRAVFFCLRQTGQMG